MKEAELIKILNEGKRKFSEDELKIIVSLLKRLAEIEYSNNILQKANRSNQNEQ